MLERLNLQIAPGSFVSLVGPSGAGKSTMLRMILGQEHPTRGQILLDGVPMQPEPGPDRGVVFQRYSVFPHLTRARQCAARLRIRRQPVHARGCSARRASAAIEESDKLIAEVGLAEHRDKYPHQLSGGMQQRLAIAQAIAKKPKVLLLDEPFGALDPGTRVQMHELIRFLWRDCGMTIVMVTHDIKEAFALGTRLIALDKKRRDPQAPERFGAIITYDLDLTRDSAVPVMGLQALLLAMTAQSQGAH